MNSFRPLARWPDDAHARVPATAASDTARLWRPDGCSHTCRLRAPIQVRYKTHKALEHSRYMRLTLLVNPDTWQVETVKVDEMSCALCLTDALYLTFTSGKHLFMLEPASVTTAQAHTCISPLRRRISLEWWMWWLQQQCGQQQRGQLFGVLVMVHVVAAVLVRAIGEGSEVVEWPFCDLVSVGQPCSRRAILPSSGGPFSSPHAWLRTLGGFILTCVTGCARTYAVAVPALPL